MKRGDELELSIEKFADRGKSLGKINGYVVFVPGGVPGDVARVRIVRKKKSFAEARIIDLQVPSDLRTEPRCRYFWSCGGCKWQHVSYEAQLAAKRNSVSEALTYHGGFSDVEVEPTVGSDELYHYRNKMEFSFGAQRWLTDWEIASEEAYDKDFALGMHVAGHFDKVLDLRECHLPPPEVATIVNEVRSFVKQCGWQPWNVRSHKGFLRHLVFRVSTHTDDFMVNLVTNAFDRDRMAEFSSFVQERFPFVTTLVNTINSGVAQTAFGESEEVLFGPGNVCDMIGPYRYEIAPNAFFQTNTRQAEKLYEIALRYADPYESDLVFDLYCGAGTISLFLASRARHVVGVELIEQAVANARRNAQVNGIENCTFESGDLMRMFKPDFIHRHGRPDVLVADPPRAGMHEKIVRQIAELKPERLVYVSCNPITQARDLALLNEVYEIRGVQPVDLFPHTHHIENVIQLKVRKN